MVNGQSTSRSFLDSKSIVQRLQECGVEHLKDEDEVWAIVDPSELRKPYAREMEDLMWVRALEGRRIVPGYRTLNVLGVGRGGRRGILYHRLFSSRENGFESETSEIETALESVGTALREKTGQVTYIFDRQFDNIAIWGKIWEQGNHLVGRLQHRERLVEGLEGQTVSIEQALQGSRELARSTTELMVRKTGQPRAKLQPVNVVISASPIRVSYQVDVRSRKDGQMRDKDAWLVKIKLEKVDWDPWLLITDWPVVDEAGAIRALMMYRMRWAIEDSFKFTKQLIGWEAVQLLSLEAVRTLLALGWVAAGFLYELGVTLQWDEVRLLGRLGGWQPRKDKPPGKTILTRGLQRMIDHFATTAVLQDEIRLYGSLPPRIAALGGIKC
jgi:hypothetical protein